VVKEIVVVVVSPLQGKKKPIQLNFQKRKQIGDI